MNLLKHIHPDCVFTGLEVDSVEELLRIQSESIVQRLPERYREQVTEASLLELLLDRESKQSTGLGDGIAVPHARISGVNHLGLSIAILKKPLDFNSIDGEPVRIAFMVVAPAETPNIVIKIWSTLARLLTDPAVRQYFLQADSPQTVCTYLEERDLNLDLTVTAADIMVPQPYRITPDMPIQDVTQLMYRHKDASVGVVDEEGRFLGQVNSDTIFKFGMPDFFSQLQSVSFVRHFNPLEKYFQQDMDLHVADIIHTECAKLPPSATLLEVIFQLTVKRRFKVYIVNDQGKYLGAIDRLSMIDRVINF